MRNSSQHRYRRMLVPARIPLHRLSVLSRQLWGLILINQQNHLTPVRFRSLEFTIAQGKTRLSDTSEVLPWEMCLVDTRSDRIVGDNSFSSI